MKVHKDVLVGVFFLILQLIISYATISSGNLYNFLWFCNHAPLLFGIAFLIKKHQLVKALISFGFLGQLIWVLDFLAKLVFDTYLIGVTQYVFQLQGFGLTATISAHVLSTFLALYMTYKDPVKSNSLQVSLAYLVIIFGLSYLIVPSHLNVNCINYLCGFEELEIPFYTFLLPISAYIFMILPTYYFQKFLYKISKK